MEKYRRMWLLAIIYINAATITILLIQIIPEFYINRFIGGSLGTLTLIKICVWFIVALLIYPPALFAIVTVKPKLKITITYYIFITAILILICVNIFLTPSYLKKFPLVRRKDSSIYEAVKDESYRYTLYQYLHQYLRGRPLVFCRNSCLNVDNGLFNDLSIFTIIPPAQLVKTQSMCTETIPSIINRKPSIFSGPKIIVSEFVSACGPDFSAEFQFAYDYSSDTVYCYQDKNQFYIIPGALLH